MLASELIAKMQALIDKYGDGEVTQVTPSKDVPIRGCDGDYVFTGTPRNHVRSFRVRLR